MHWPRLPVAIQERIPPASTLAVSITESVPLPISSAIDNRHACAEQPQLISKNYLSLGQ